MKSQVEDYLLSFFESVGLSSNNSEVMKTLLIVLSIFMLSIIAFYFTRRVLLNIIHKYAESTKTKWDDILIARSFFRRLSLAIPGLILISLLPSTLSGYPVLKEATIRILDSYLILVLLLVFDSFLSALYDIYSRYEISKAKPIRSYIQVVKIFLYFIGGIIIIAFLIDQDPTKLLTGLGAISAILILIFKDSILGLVGGIQLSANDMLRPGDWIEMPTFSADGVVIDISLTTVKVQNWNKTISTIPTYSMVTNSFKNWRGMEESGGRRIKRSINIDMNTVRFCDQDMLERFSKIQVLEKYLQTTEKTLNAYNEKNHIDDSVMVNGRRQTNLGVFRAYLENYLKGHPDVRSDMTFLVRHLQPGEKGLPIEIYFFSKVQAWAEYESIQADIFDHILAVLPEFGLHVFQNPTGMDFRGGYNNN